MGAGPGGRVTSEALIGYLEELEARCSPATVKKERAALRELARYLHQLRLIDATVDADGRDPDRHGQRPRAQGLDRASWEGVLTVARARLAGSARARCSPTAAARDLALIQVARRRWIAIARGSRRCPSTRSIGGRSDNQGGSVYLKVRGKGNKVRDRPAV